MPSNATKKRVSTRNATINIRAQARQRELIDQAAEATGKTRSDFMLEAACQKAEDVLLDRRIFNLADEQWQAFLTILDAPAQSNEKLKNLLTTPAPWDV